MKYPTLPIIQPSQRCLTGTDLANGTNLQLTGKTRYRKKLSNNTRKQPDKSRSWGKLRDNWRGLFNK